MDDLYFKQVCSTLLFPTRSTEDVSKYISVTKQFLWRRDSHRLVAFLLDKKQLNADFLLPPEEEWSDTLKMNVTPEGSLSFLTKEKETLLFPSSKQFHAHSLKTLSSTEWDLEFELPSKLLSRHISVLQRKVLENNLKMEDVTILLDLKKQQLSLKELNIEKPISVSLKKGNPIILSYSFAFFRDLLINSNKFNQTVLFRSILPFYSAIRYDNRLFGVLLHKKD